MSFRYIIFLVITGISFHGLGQNADHPPGKVDHDEMHEHHSNEFGAANSAVYFIKEKSLNYGLHLHYTYTIRKTKFGIGAGYERIFDEHKHNTIGIHAIYQPVEGLHLNLSPGVAFEGDGDEHPVFALHFETSYEFLFHDFHIGPSVEFAYDPEDYHISLGIHIGYGF
jgi:hypothetical protein